MVDPGPSYVDSIVDSALFWMFRLIRADVIVRSSKASKTVCVAFDTEPPVIGSLLVINGLEFDFESEMGGSDTDSSV